MDLEKIAFKSLQAFTLVNVLVFVYFTLRYVSEPWFDFFDVWDVGLLIYFFQLTLLLVVWLYISIKISKVIG